MASLTETEKLHRRLKKVIGQVGAIDHMIESDVPCEDVLVQISAAKGALHKVGQLLLEEHMKNCVRESLIHGDLEQAMEELASILEQFRPI